MKRKLIPVIFLGIVTILFFYYGGFGTRQDEEKPVTLAEFNSKIKESKKPVLVYFSAGWCTVCGKMKPVIAEIEKEYGDKVEFFKIDADRDKEVADEFEINSLPVIMLYTHNNREWIHIGIIEKSRLKEKIFPFFTIDQK